MSCSVQNPSGVEAGRSELKELHPFKEIIPISAKKNDPDGRRARAKRVIAAWDDLLALMEKDLPAYQDMAEYMKKLGMPTKPEEIGLSRQDVLDAFVCSRDIRNKYILSSMIWDIGYMEDCTAWLDSQLDELI